MAVVLAAADVILDSVMRLVDDARLTISNSELSAALSLILYAPYQLANSINNSQQAIIGRAVQR